MEYQRSSMVMNRKQQASTNPQIYASFAGAGVNKTPDGILDDIPTMWWDEEKIEATVTRQFVLSKLRPDEQGRLDVQLDFGATLTDNTYMDWIEEKARKLFLILVDLGVPDQIFAVIDDSWDDDDLPIPLDQVGRLQLTYERDEKLERKFFQRQFSYLLRYISKGENVYYDDAEVVPLELAEKRPVGSVAGILPSSVDKVHLPGKPNRIFLRRRIALGNSADRMPREEFLSGIEAMRGVEHAHLTSLWASYVYQDNGYLLLTPANEHSLRSFLTITPQSFKILAKQDRRILLMNWLHCLANALAFLHNLGLSHHSIKPSNVMLDLENNIFLGDSRDFNAHTGKQGFDKEIYDYSAPEQAHHHPASSSSLTAGRATTSRPNTSSRSAGVPTSSPPRAASVSHSNDSASIHTTSTSSQPESFGLWQSTGHGRLGKHDPQKADIFSLGAIFLEILTFMLKRASRNFASHRSSKNKTPGRGGGLPDSSFHKNMGQVESWMNILLKDATKKEDKIFRGVSQVIGLCHRMLSTVPDERPSASEVQTRLYSILTENCGLSGDSGDIHCETRVTEAQWNFGFDQLRLASQRAAAEACASVAGDTVRNIPTGNGGVIYGVERIATVVNNGVPLSSMIGRDGDRISINTKTSSGKSSEGNVNGKGKGAKPEPKLKAKAWQAPVYAGELWIFTFPYSHSLLDVEERLLTCWLVQN
ncbi:kinase domain-containing protein [Rutstroemia sp. NJR-2017a BVV2]|nr:kinase domain-containing protein [Rutstroemia sp. NJR-2017a BVV2]